MSVKNTAKTQGAVRSSGYRTEELIGNGFEGVTKMNGTPFINLSFDPGINFDALAAELKAGKRLSLVARKAHATNASLKWSVALRAPQQA